MLSYAKSVVWDFLIVAVLSLSLSYTLLNCFYIDPGLQYSAWPALVCLVALVVLYAAAMNGRTARIGGLAYAGMLVVALAASAVASSTGSMFDDAEGNLFIFMATTLFTATACFLLSRKRVGAVLLFIVGVLIVGVTQFLYERFDVVWALAFVVSSLALVVYRNFQESMRSADSVRSPRLVPGFAVALAAGLVAVGVGAAVWFGVVAPLNPPAAEIKLVTEYRALETKEVKGVSDVYMTPNIDMTGSKTNKAERTTDDVKESKNGRQMAANGKDSSDDSEQTSGGAVVGINVDNPDQVYDMQSNFVLQLLAILVPLLIVVLIVAYFVGRRIIRCRRLKRLQQLPPDERVRSLFPWLMGRFSRMGIKIPAGQTLHEFSEGAESVMRPFNEAAGVSFSQLSAAYAGVAYGNCGCTEEQAHGFENFYKAFWKAAREHLGSFKYFFTSFRL